MDRLRAHKLFCRVLELGSFSSAAREARLAQPSVSRAVAELERSLGVRLLERTTRRVAPTLEGRAYYAQIEEAVRAFDNAEAAAKSGFAELAGHVRIAVPGALGRKLLLPRVAALLIESPELRVDVSVSDQPIDFLAGGFDFAIRVGASAPDSFVARELGRSAQWFVASPRYLAIHGTPVSMDELGSHHFVLRGAVPKPLARYDVTLRSSTDEIETAHVCACAGVGIAILPRWLVARDAADGRLSRLLPDVDLGAPPIIATYPAARRLRKSARRVLERLEVTLQRALESA